MLPKKAKRQFGGPIEQQDGIEDTFNDSFIVVLDTLKCIPLTHPQCPQHIPPARFQMRPQSPHNIKDN